MDFILRFLLFGLLLSAVIAALIVFFGVRLGERFERSAGALALAAGFLAGYAGQEWASLRPIDSMHWLPYLAVLSIVETATPRARWPARIAVAGLAGWLLVPSYPKLEPFRLYWSGGIALTIVALASANGLGKTPPILLCCVSLAGAGVLELSGNGMIAQMAGMLAASLAGIALIYWKRASAAGMNLALGAAVLLTGLMATGYFDSAEPPHLAYLLIVAAPLAGWIGALLPVQEKRRLWTQAALMALPALAAVVLASL